MKSDEFQTPFSNALLTAVFTGFISTIVCLVYNLVYREESGFMPSAIINVSSLIFGINIFFLVVGPVYYLLRKFYKKGDLVFIILFALLTIFFAWKSEGVNRSIDYNVTLRFRGLLLGIVLIVGVSVCFIVPFLFHNKKFNREVL